MASDDSGSPVAYRTNRAIASATLENGLTEGERTESLEAPFASLMRAQAPMHRLSADPIDDDTVLTLLDLASKITWSSGEPFRVGVALHFGAVTCGNVGVDAQRDATIIGDAVNTVFRLESVMKELNQQVLLSADFREHLPASESLIDLGERKLKGKQQAVQIYGLD